MAGKDSDLETRRADRTKADQVGQAAPRDELIADATWADARLLGWAIAVTTSAIATTPTGTGEPAPHGEPAISLVHDSAEWTR